MQEGRDLPQQAERHGDRAVIDIVVPVYRGEAETRRCLESVYRAGVAAAYELVVVDDASPEPGLVDWLSGEAARGRITLLRNPTNLGFVGSVNRGMALHPERDVVLLNSDTEVANDWLDRLSRCAGAAPDIATVTPFSNNATICSYPYDGWPGEVPGQLGLAALDRLFARVHDGVTVELPTAVGFCMFIRRACLQQIGAFDAEAFGRGYGEENDFSLRASKAGWRNVLCADTFVYHRGGVSFGAERDALMAAAGQVLKARHPDYDMRVAGFIGGDPLRPLRDAIDRARVAAGSEEAAAVLAERHLERDGLRHALGQFERIVSPDPAGEVAQPLRRQWRALLERSAARLGQAERPAWCRLLASVCRLGARVIGR